MGRYKGRRRPPFSFCGNGLPQRPENLILLRDDARSSEGSHVPPARCMARHRTAGGLRVWVCLCRPLGGCDPARLWASGAVVGGNNDEVLASPVFRGLYVSGPGSGLPLQDEAAGCLPVSCRGRLQSAPRPTGRSTQGRRWFRSPAVDAPLAGRSSRPRIGEGMAIMERVCGRGTSFHRHRVTPAEAGVQPEVTAANCAG